MADQNEGATEQLEEVSGRWLRDQLREVGENTPPEPTFESAPGDKSPVDKSSSQLIEGLAASISAAVVEPIRGLESRREARQEKLEQSLQELSGKLGDAFVEIGKLRDQAAQALADAQEAKAEAKREVEEARTQLGADLEAARTQAKADVEALGSEAKNEIETIRSATRQEIDQLNATTSDLQSSFNSLAEEIGRLQEKVREQHERIDALRFRETQRAKAMNELARASSTLREAVAAAAAMAGPSEDEAAAPRS